MLTNVSMVNKNRSYRRFETYGSSLWLLGLGEEGLNGIRRPLSVPGRGIVKALTV